MPKNSAIDTAPPASTVFVSSDSMASVVSAGAPLSLA